VLNGYYYSIVEPATITLAPGETLDEPIVLQVQVKTSRILGQLNGMTSTEPLDIFAVHLPDGLVVKTLSDGNAFEFRDLPSGEYLLMPDPQVASRLGISSQPISVDLTQNPEAAVTLELTSATEIASRNIQLRDETGYSLPFGWLTSASDSLFLPDPVTGALTFTAAASASQTVTTLVPGYYSQTQVLDFSDSSNLTFTLTRQPETLSLPWGSGNIILPSETVYTHEANNIRLTRGWVWGQGNGESVTISVAGVQVELTDGTFAIQYLPSEGGWMILPEGEAVIQMADGLNVQVRGGEMVSLVEGESIHPVPYVAAVFAALNPVTDAPILVNWEPSLKAQLQNRLAKIGINAAQVITFVTYLIVFAVLVAFIGRGIYWLWNEFKKS